MMLSCDRRWWLAREERSGMIAAEKGAVPSKPLAFMTSCILLLLLGACSSIPMSTLTQPGQLNERDFLSLVFRAWRGMPRCLARTKVTA
jgi:hypothetical protein